MQNTATKRTLLAIVVFSTIPAIIRVLSKALYVEVKPNVFVLTFENPWLYAVGSILSVCIWSVVGIVSFILGLRTIVAYKRMTKENRRKYRNDLLLFGKRYLWHVLTGPDRPKMVL